MDKKLIVAELIRIAKNLTEGYLKKAQIEKNCPSCLLDNEINAQNHVKTMKEHGLGPLDPRQTNMDFWNDKAKKWNITEGDARGRLCSNCEHFLETTEIKDCIENGPALNFKTSQVPYPEKIADVESKPVAVCMLYNITCSPTRVCDSQEPGGPIDDIKARAIELTKKTNAKIPAKEIVQKLVDSVNNKIDIDEYNNPFEMK